MGYHGVGFGLRHPMAEVTSYPEYGRTVSENGKEEALSGAWVRVVAALDP